MNLPPSAEYIDVTYRIDGPVPLFVETHPNAMELFSHGRYSVQASLCPQI